MKPTEIPGAPSGEAPGTDPTQPKPPMPPMPPLRLMEGGTIDRRERLKDGGYAWAERPDPALRAQIGAAALRRVVGGDTVVDMTSTAFANSALWADDEPRAHDRVLGRWREVRRRVPLLLAIVAVVASAALLTHASR